MSIHLSEVYEYLDAHPVSKYPDDFKSMLEMLHYIYTAANPIDNQRIRSAFENVEEILCKLSIEDADELFSIFGDLCMEYEEASFSQGLLAGMHLMTELNALAE